MPIVILKRIMLQQGGTGPTEISNKAITSISVRLFVNNYSRMWYRFLNSIERRSSTSPTIITRPSFQKDYHLFKHLAHNMKVSKD